MDMSGTVDTSGREDMERLDSSEQQHRSLSSASSQASMGNPISFDIQPCEKPPPAQSQEQAPDSESRTQPGAYSSVGSCDSLKSDWSMEEPFFFKHEPSSLQQRSPWSQPFKDLTVHSNIMKEVRQNIHEFVESEVLRLDRLLSPESEEVSEQVTDGPADDEEDEEEQRSREAVVTITTHILRRMKQDHVAECLLNRTKAAKCLYDLRCNLGRRFQHVFEGVKKAGTPTGLNQIYTELWVTEGETGVSNEHEVQHIQTAARKEDKTIKCEQIFENLLSGGKWRTMMTKGVAGIGKTILTQKVVVDWAERKAHHKISLMFPLCFRELNVLREKDFSLVGLVHYFFAEMKEAKVGIFDDDSVVFIFDGLDEFRLELKFDECQSVTDPTEKVPLDVLLVNLIKGKLLPSARLWITTRPAAANQIPADYISMVTEVQGFTNQQKEQYFRKRFEDQQQATSVISHITKSKCLHNMSYIPIFCWIISTVLHHLMKSTDQLPQTLTQMYIHFLVVQTKVKSVKYDGRSETDPHWTPETRKMVESLGKLAFEQLQKGILIFYESDLRQCGLDPTEASVYSGVFTQVFREETGLYQDKVYCFVHLSVQEFLAALYVHLTFFNCGLNLLSEAQSPNHKPRPVNDKGAVKAFYRSAVDKALKSFGGHLDLFLRFLLALSLQRNIDLLQGLMRHTQPSPHSSREAAGYIKVQIAKGLPSDKAFNLFHCLNELSDRTLIEEVQKAEISGSFSKGRLTYGQWSALVFILRSDGCEVFQLCRFSCTEEAFFRLLPVIKDTRESSLSGCILSKPCCEALATLLRKDSCLLKNLDVSYTELQDSGLFTLTQEPRSPLCRLQVLRLRGCKLSEEACSPLSSVLSSPDCRLTELDVSDNDLQDSGVKKLSQGLQSPHCHLTILRLSSCGMSGRSCEGLRTVLECERSILKELDLSNNSLQYHGVEQLCGALRSPHCRLETLRLSGCALTEQACSVVASALSHSHVTELDLNYNHPGARGTQLLSACSLSSLRLDHCGSSRLKPGLSKYACEVTLDAATAHRNLLVFENNSLVNDEEDTPDEMDPERFDFWMQVVCCEGLRGRCYWEVVWSGLVSIGVTYRSIQRRGGGEDSRLGGNSTSWTMDCSSHYYTAWHNDVIVKHIKNSSDAGKSRLGVYLDWEAGTVSFYTVTSDRPKLLHTFCCSFTEPLHPAFRVRAEFTRDISSSVSVCQNTTTTD